MTANVGSARLEDARRAVLDAEKLWEGSAILLSKLGQEPGAVAVMGVAGSAPCGGEPRVRESLCDRLLIKLERGARGTAGDAVFLALAAYFLDDVPGWPLERRKGAEDALDAMLDRAG